ncbi:MAG: reverse transcriptase domain-containing protein, partial [Anaerolineae bacterium]
MVNEFLKVFSQRERLGFPAALQQAYSELVADLRGRVAYLDDEPYSLDDDSAASVASQFYRLFPSHCLKCLDSLVREESEALQRGGTGLILGWPTVTLLDIGCGTGAATAALLTLIQAYQEFLRRDGRPLRRVSVQAVGLDPSESMLELYTALLENYSYLLADWLIDVNVHAVAERFPDGVSEISRVLKPGNAHLGLAAMSNIVRVMQRSFDAGSTVWFERVRRAVAGEPVGEPRFGEAEGNALKGVLENWGLDKIALLGIATAGEHEATHSAWHRILEEMDNGIADTMLPHRVDRRGVKEVRAVFENPLDSWWRASKGRATYEERYYRDFMLITHEGYDADEQWRSVISAKNLELAWARARRHALHEDLADEIEVLLFDRSVHKKLDRLRRHLLLGDWSALQLGHMQLYEAPKKRGETRPRALVRLEEQIVAAAVVQSVGSSGGAHRGASYSYRLNDEPDEFLYQYWLGLWKSFLAHSHKRAHAGTVLRSDVSHFYERVQQALLVDVVRRVLRAGARLDELASALLLRDCGPPHSCGRGLPQGHVASGFWADLYLGEADRAFRGLKGVTFARYADDMVFVVDRYESDVARTERELRTALDQLYL